MADTSYKYTFMEVHVWDENGKTANEKFFVSRLPAIGEVCEMVFVGFNDEGGMRLQLRVREPGTQQNA